MRDSFKGFAAAAKGEPLKLIEFDPGELRAEQVEVEVEYCGICHSDVSMLDNEWGMTQYPLVPGHEVVGKIVALGTHAKGLRLGQRVGIGWMSGSCLSCRQCLSGDHNLCAQGEATIVHRHGGFADRVRAQWPWAIPLPEGVDPAKAGPLFCGGITVFNPILQAHVKPTERVGVIGIGGLGHMALSFLASWGCEVYAFTSSESKREEAMRLGAHHVVNSRDSPAMQKIAGSLDFVLVTVNVPLDWKAIIQTLAPRGRLHFVGAVLEPVPVEVFSLLVGQRVISGSPTGSPVAVADMLEFCARHSIAPVVEIFAMSDVNQALDHVRAGKARYRVVLRN
jgi:alcohol/geraniol dehydrogenase (NADP+)